MTFEKLAPSWDELRNECYRLRIAARRDAEEIARLKDVIGDLVHLAWTTGPITRTQEDFKNLPQIKKANDALALSVHQVTPPNSL